MEIKKTTDIQLSYGTEVVESNPPFSLEGWSIADIRYPHVERKTGLEPATSTLARWRSTHEHFRTLMLFIDLLIKT